MSNFRGAKALSGIPFGLFVVSTFLGCAAGSSQGGEEASEEGKSGDGDSASEQEDFDEISLDGSEGILAPPSAKGFGGAEAGSSDSCLSIASLGTVQQEGAVPGKSGQDAMVEWFNSATSADALHFIDKPDFTEEFLEHFDLLLLQNLRDFSLSQPERDVVKAWVNQGGAILALSGHSQDGEDAVRTNEMVSFSGLNFSVSSGPGETAAYLGECGYCLGTSFPQGGWQAEHPISFQVTAVGAYQGRPIYGQGEIVAQENGKVLGMTSTYGQGKVFLFHDDWVSFPALWDAEPTVECQSNLSCADVSPRVTYQVAQFWYNAVTYLVPRATCFSLADSSVVVVK